MYYLSLPVIVYTKVGTELGTDNGKTERQSTKTINLRQPTPIIRNQQQAPAETPNNLQLALYNQLDNQQQTTASDS
jgi:hypothetical protein